MSWFELIAERKIRDAQEEGLFDNLPGKGRPLDLESDARIPPELRAAYRIMKESKVLPDWIELARDLRLRQERWEQRVEEFERRRRQELDAHTGPARGELEQRLDRSRDLFLQAAADELREQNRMIDRLNLIVPATSQQRVRLNLAVRMDELEARFARFQPHLGPPDQAPWRRLIEEHRPPTRLANRLPKRSRRGVFG